MKRYCGRDFSESELALIRALLAEDPQRTRADFSRLACRALHWHKPDGGLKDMSCRVAMLCMQKDGLIQLPPPRGQRPQARLMANSHDRPNRRLAPRLAIRRLGIVSRDYCVTEKNRHSDFGQAFPAILRRLDALDCDAVLFALYTIVKRRSFKVGEVLESLGLQRVRSVFVEEFKDAWCRKTRQRTRKPERFAVHYRASRRWRQVELKQKLGSLEYTKKFASEAVGPFMEEK